MPDISDVDREQLIRDLGIPKTNMKERMTAAKQEAEQRFENKELPQKSMLQKGKNYDVDKR